MKFIRSIVLGTSLLLTFSVNADLRDDIEARIKPIGQVQIAGDAATKIVSEDASEAVPAAASAMSGEDVYKKHCVVCHAAGVAGAPKFQDKASWSARQSKGIDVLLKTAITGLNAMPPKGTCMNCSDDELKSAIEYMLPK